jgi:hypothetical protein
VPIKICHFVPNQNSALAAVTAGQFVTEGNLFLFFSDELNIGEGNSLLPVGEKESLGIFYIFV